ncbi:nicotinamidase-like amidase [Thermanaerovibrio velox DSM 12556]|jgi:nicotinamidase/pyrazinamidase|uniref:Nicotinamidase n=1 Tax=Thermanaerovibrio velox DSM 12556 TaxID=926567 RepID=H0UP60_9BACT|nr:bifunctional nicotinamidase/pyrazinamidase [Thermanaerovibrio velox]EHM09473.1 nicotinamidase-like amidase [Thermanaerovibrio velox DSM 12556]
MRALLVVDVQYDFLPGGALPVPHGDLVIPVINKIMDRFPLVVATQDWHPKGHLSFASSHEGKDAFQSIHLNGQPQTLWPDHCVQGTEGAMISNELRQEPIQLIIRKGTDPKVDSYSAFFDNLKIRPTGLAGYLRERGVTEVWVAGLAGDYCAFYSAMDAAEAGFSVFFLEDGVRPISPEGFERAKEAMIQRWIKIVTSSQLDH